MRWEALVLQNQKGDPVFIVVPPGRVLGARSMKLVKAVLHGCR